jgi:hypothetical protein
VKNNNDVLLAWSSENEMNSSGFDIEFSSDGMTFTKLSTLKSKNLPGRNEYSFMHFSPGNTVLFYRLKQVDHDGKTEYSKVIKMDMGNVLQIRLYPNPANNFIQLKNCREGDVQGMQILSSDGKVIITGSANSRMQYDISRLKAGIYMLKLVMKDHSISLNRFEKQ